MRVEKQEAPRRLNPDNIVDDRLSIVLGGIETMLKPYPHSLQTRVSKVNGAAQEIVIIATIKVQA